MLRPALSSHETLLPRVSGGEGLSNNPGQMVPMFAQALTSTEEGRDRPFCASATMPLRRKQLLFSQLFTEARGGHFMAPLFSSAYVAH